jgi:hypothetical protein
LYQESDGAFVSYYRANILPALEQALAAANQGTDPVAQALAQLNYDKAVRISGGEADFGIATALALATSTDATLRIWAAAALGDIGTADALRSLAILAADTDPTVAAYSAAAQQQAAVSSCEAASVTIINGGRSHIVNLGSKKPIVAEVRLSRERNGQLIGKSIRFGEAGNEQSLLACDVDDDDKHGREIRLRYVCQFRTTLTNLQLGDGVATLFAKRRNGACVSGQTAVEVQNIPHRAD